VGLYGTIFDEIRVFEDEIGYIGTKSAEIGFRHTTKIDQNCIILAANEAYST